MFKLYRCKLRTKAYRKIKCIFEHKTNFFVSKIYLIFRETKDSLKIQWNDGHKSNFNFQFLKDNIYAPREVKKAEWKPLTNVEKLDFKELETENGVWKWLNYLNEDGVAIIQNVPTDLGYVEKVANKISYVVRSYL